MQSAHEGLIYGLLLRTNIHIDKMERSYQDSYCRKKKEMESETGIKILGVCYQNDESCCLCLARHGKFSIHRQLTQDKENSKL